MDPLRYAFMAITLFVAGCIIALYTWRALYRVYTRSKDESERAAAVARIEEQSRRLDEQLKND